MNGGSYRITNFKSVDLPNTALKNFIYGEIKTGLFDFLKLWENLFNTLIRSFPQLSKVVNCPDIAFHAVEKVYLPITTDITTHQRYIILPCIYFSKIQLDNSILFVPFYIVPNYVLRLGIVPLCRPLII